MAAASRRTVLHGAALTLLIASLSSALPAGRRSGSIAGPDKFVSRDQLLSSHKKEIQDDEAVRQLTELVEQLTAKRSHSVDNAAEAHQEFELKSRGQGSRRAAFDDEDPLHILLGNQGLGSTRNHIKDGRTMENSVKKKILRPVANKRSDVIRTVGRDVVGGLSNNQRQLQKVRRPSRQDFMYAIGAAERPSYGYQSSILSDFPYGSQRDSTSDDDSDYGYEYEWVECDENDPECEEEE